MMSNKRDWTNILSKLTAWLVVTITGLAFVLSYNALWGTALTYGLPNGLAWIWPLLIDFPLIVFSLAVVRANLLGESTKWPWFLVAVFTGATVVMNLLHLENNIIRDWFTQTTIAQFVAVVAPLALFLSFETLMGMVKSGVKRGGLHRTLTGLTEQATNLQLEIDSLTFQRNNLVDAVNQLKTTLETAKTESEQHRVAKVSRDTFDRALEVAREHYAVNHRLPSSTELAQTLDISKTAGNNIVRALGPMFTNGKQNGQ